MENQIHLTVATVVERNGKFLCVAERDKGKLVINQPAGHVEPGEKIADAALREALEETGWHIELTALISFSTYLAGNGVTYYRVCFAARAKEEVQDAPLDSDIDEVLWLSYEELAEQQAQLRSPLVLQAVEDYRNGCLQPLSMLRE